MRIKPSQHVAHRNMISDKSLTSAEATFLSFMERVPKKLRKPIYENHILTFSGYKTFKPCVIKILEKMVYCDK